MINLCDKKSSLFSCFNRSLTSDTEAGTYAIQA